MKMVVLSQKLVGNLSRLIPNIDALFQCPKQSMPKSGVWNKDCIIGISKIQNITKEISAVAELPYEALHIKLLTASIPTLAYKAIVVILISNEKCAKIYHQRSTLQLEKKH